MIYDSKFKNGWPTEQEIVNRALGFKVLVAHNHTLAARR